MNKSISNEKYIALQCGTGDDNMENEDPGFIWIKYFAKVERRNLVKGLVLGHWRVYFLMGI